MVGAAVGTGSTVGGAVVGAAVVEEAMVMVGAGVVVTATAAVTVATVVGAAPGPLGGAAPGAAIVDDVVVVLVLVLVLVLVVASTDRRLDATIVDPSAVGPSAIDTDTSFSTLVSVEAVSPVSTCTRAGGADSSVVLLATATPSSVRPTPIAPAVEADDGGDGGGARRRRR